MIRKLAVFLLSMLAGIFFTRATEALWRHAWWTLSWDLVLTIGWSLVAWSHLKQLKETA